ncbi:MAG: DNA-directed RNA polymerase subunit D [Candidatus Hodarchaeota archaeon]
MKIRILEKDDNHIQFYVEGIDSAFANSLRRIMVSEVPSMTIDDVMIVENTSPLFDEVLVHRLGLIPLVTDLDSYLLPNACSCNGSGCAQCQVILTINKEATEGGMIVYSGDLESQDPKVIPASDKIPLVKLAKGQRLVLEAYARLGIGRVHAKYQPVSGCSYRYKPIIDIELDKCELCEECIKSCPKNILRQENGTLMLHDALSCNLCKSCVESCENDAIHISWDESTFIFDVESTGALPPSKIVEKAAEILEKKAEEFIELVGVAKVKR